MLLLCLFIINLGYQVECIGRRFSLDSGPAAVWLANNSAALEVWKPFKNSQDKLNNVWLSRSDSAFLPTEATFKWFSPNNRCNHFIFKGPEVTKMDYVLRFDASSLCSLSRYIFQKVDVPFYNTNQQEMNLIAEIQMNIYKCLIWSDRNAYEEPNVLVRLLTPDHQRSFSSTSNSSTSLSHTLVDSSFCPPLILLFFKGKSVSCMSGFYFTSPLLNHCDALFSWAFFTHTLLFPKHTHGTDTQPAAPLIHTLVSLMSLVESPEAATNQCQVRHAHLSMATIM